jgi:hypothetical protein
MQVQLLWKHSTFYDKDTQKFLLLFIYFYISLKYIQWDGIVSNYKYLKVLNWGMFLWSVQSSPTWPPSTINLKICQTVRKDAKVMPTILNTMNTYNNLRCVSCSRQRSKQIDNGLCCVGSWSCYCWGAQEGVGIGSTAACRWWHFGLKVLNICITKQFTTEQETALMNSRRVGTIMDMYNILEYIYTLNSWWVHPVAMSSVKY